MSGFPFPSIPSNYLAGNFYQREGGWTIPATASPATISQFQALLQPGYLYECTYDHPVDSISGAVTVNHTIAYQITTQKDDEEELQLVRRDFFYRPGRADNPDPHDRPVIRGFGSVNTPSVVIFRLKMAQLTGTERQISLSAGGTANPTVFALKVVAEKSDIHFFNS